LGTAADGNGCGIGNLVVRIEGDAGVGDQAGACSGGAASDDEIGLVGLRVIEGARHSGLGAEFGLDMDIR